jgi:hypothetical protein
MCGGGWPPKWTPVEVLTPEEQAAEDAAAKAAKDARVAESISAFKKWLIDHNTQVDKKKSEIPPPSPPSPPTNNIKWWWWLIIGCFIIILFYLLSRTFATR